MPSPTSFLDAHNKEFFLSIHLTKVSDDLFLVVSPNFTFISILFLQFIPHPYPGCPGPSLFLLFLIIYLHFFEENSVVGCPLRLDAWGCHTPRTPSARHWAQHNSAVVPGTANPLY